MVETGPRFFSLGGKEGAGAVVQNFADELSLTGVCCLDDEFFGRLPEGNSGKHAKSLCWLTSARLAGGYEYAPVSGADAIRALGAHDDPFADWVDHAVRFCRQTSKSSVEGFKQQRLRELCERTLEFENATLAVLREAIEDKGRLGPRCAEVIEQYVTFG